MREFSVLLLFYNSETDAIVTTLDSIICQKDVDMELIMADDASENNCMDKAIEYLESKNYTNYKVIRHPKNVGTVQNLYDALLMSTKKYVKSIGAGDLFYSETTLSEVYDHMVKENSVMSFGKTAAFYKDKNGELKVMPFYLPSDIKAFEKGNYKRMQKDIVQNHGWIVGASMFYKKETLKKYMEGILGKVRYCEDLLQATLFLNNENVTYYPHGVFYYEVGTGISTNNSGGNSQKLQKDHNEYWKMMLAQNPDNKLVRNGYKMQRLQCIKEPLRRKMAITLHNRSYVIMMLRTLMQKKSYIIKEKGLLS